MAVDLNIHLTDAGIPLEKTLVMRHTPVGRLIFNRYTLLILAILWLIGHAYGQSPPPPTEGSYWGNTIGSTRLYSHPAHPEWDGTPPPDGEIRRVQLLAEFTKYSNALYKRGNELIK
jgi:hypothetical protein